MIRINNRDEVTWVEGLTVAGLLEQLRFTYPHLVVKIDGEVIPDEAFPTRTIPNGADVWVIHLIAGG